VSNILLEFDKAGAEWVVVAYLSGDARMLQVISEGKSPHVETGHLITRVPHEIILKEHKIVGSQTDPDLIIKLREAIPELMDPDPDWFVPRSMSIRQAGKKSNHGLNYGMRYRRFALENEIPEPEAKIMVEGYNTRAYPGVPLWQKATQQELKTNHRILTNCFGRKVRLMDQWGDDLFNAAYSFKPQSTIGDIVNNALKAAYRNRSPVFLPMDLLTQTHDSATVQYPTSDWDRMAEFCIEFGLGLMSPEIEYNARKFKVGTDLKIGLSWGDMVGVPLVENVKELSDGLQFAWEEVSNRREAV